MNRRNFLIQSTAVGLLTMLAGATRAAPRTITDDRNVVLNLPDDAKRVAAISYFGADVALALGLTPVATTYMVEGRNPDHLLDRLEGVAKIGQRASPNLELLAQAKPDLIVAIKRYTEANAAKLEQIAPYLAVRLETPEDADRDLLLVAEALGKKAEGEKLVTDYHAEFDALVAKAPKDRGIKYLYFYGSGEAPWAFYEDDVTASILTALGGVNVAGKNPTPEVPDNTAFEMNLEAMLVADPDVIIVYDYGPDRPFETNPIWSSLRAVQEGKVHFVKDHWIESHGPIARRVVINEAAAILYPDVFKAEDPRAIASRILG